MIKAFLMGVSDYSSLRDVQDLPFAANDIKLMSHALVQGLCVKQSDIRTAGLSTGRLVRESFLRYK